MFDGRWGPANYVHLNTWDLSELILVLSWGKNTNLSDEQEQEYEKIVKVIVMGIVVSF